VFKKGLLFIILLSLLLEGCSLLDTKKPSYNYYSLEVAKLMKADKKMNIKVTDMNYYKSIFLEKEDITTFKQLFTYLKKNNYVNKSSIPSVKPQYKIFFIFDSKEYIMNVYDTKYISVFPYDGDYEMDYINLTGTYNSLNVYNLCKYLFSKK
jgi:hypothetical protein